MSYQVHNFQPGDILLASQLNEMDEQIANISEEAGENTGVYYCTYGTTTSAEIETAYQAEMICLCEYNNLVYRLTGRADNTTHVFTCTDGAAIYVLNVMDNTWISQYADIPSAASSGTPAMDGTASRGSSAQYARADHVHPTDTSRAAASDLAAKADKITEVTVSTAGAVTQALDAGKIYHFTGALTALTITATDPMTGKYQFDFISGATAPTLIVPASWVMPDSFLVEPSARYSLSIQNGYCSLEKWSDSHSPFIYLDSTAGDFIMNDSGISSGGKVYVNVGTEVVAVNIDVKLKSQLANNAWLKICDISANAKALMGSTYATDYIAAGGGKITQCVFNTWETASKIEIKNNTGAALAANTQLIGAIFILRTL